MVGLFGAYQWPPATVSQRKTINEARMNLDIELVPYCLGKHGKGA